MEKAYAYYRKSTDDNDRQLLSLESQRQIVLELAQKNNLEIVREWTESKSAKKSGVRPGYTEMVRLLKKGDVKNIVCWKPNRLARNSTDSGPIEDLLDTSGLKIYCLKRTYDREDFELLHDQFRNSKKFSMDLSDDVKVGLNRKLENGIPPIFAPLGYYNKKEMLKGLKEIGVDMSRWALVRELWDLVLSGITVEKSLAIVNAKGLTTRGGRPLSKTQCFKLIHNPFYYGGYRYRGETHNNGIHKKMVSYSEWIKVQDLVGRRTRNGEKVKREFFFSGLIRCGECGRAIIGETKVKTRKDGSKNIFSYARCSKKLVKGHERCCQSGLNVKELDKQVTGFINDLELDPRYITWIRGVMKRRNKDEAQNESRRLSEITLKMDRILADKNDLWDKKKDGLLTQEQYEGEKVRLNHNEAILKEEYNFNGTKDWEKTLEEIADFTVKLTEAFNSGDNRLKKNILKILGSDLEIKDQKIRFIAKKAFVLLKSWANAEKAWLEPNFSFKNKENDPNGENGAGEGSRTPFISLES